MKTMCEVDRGETKGSHAFCTLNLLIQRNFQGAGKTDYLVLWKGYSREEATWVLEQDITLPALQ